MFKSAFFDKLKSKYECYFELIDSDFTCSLLSQDTGWSARLVAVFLEYKRRNLPIPKNIALMYFWFWSSARHLAMDKNHMDKYYPELEYGKIYYPCILNQYKILNYSKRK